MAVFLEPVSVFSFQCTITFLLSLNRLSKRSGRDSNHNRREHRRERSWAKNGTQQQRSGEIIIFLFLPRFLFLFSFLTFFLAFLSFLFVCIYRYPVFFFFLRFSWSLKLLSDPDQTTTSRHRAVLANFGWCVASDVDGPSQFKFLTNIIIFSLITLSWFTDTQYKSLTDWFSGSLYFSFMFGQYKSPHTAREIAAGAWLAGWAKTEPINKFKFQFSIQDLIWTKTI